MDQKQRVVVELGNQAAKSIRKIIDTPDDKEAPPTTNAILVLSLIAFSTFFGHIMMKVFFRKTPVINLADFLLLILASAGLVMGGIFNMAVFFTWNERDTFGSPDSYLITGILFIILAFKLLLKGKKFYKSKPETETESILTSLVQENWNENRIKIIGEPLFVTLVGVFFFIYNVIGGGLLILSAASEWIHIIYAKLAGKKLFAKNPKLMSGKNEEDNSYYQIM